MGLNRRKQNSLIILEFKKLIYYSSYFCGESQFAGDTSRPQFLEKKKQTRKGRIRKVVIYK